jgi:queuosine precursor transporter
MLILGYIAAIALANVLTAKFAPWLIHVNDEVIAITAGTWVIACTFWLRDLVQVAHGRRVVWWAIAGALAVNLVMSRFYGDLAWITVASGLAFVLSESIDTLVYSAVGGRLGPRIFVSGAVSCPLDSVVFVLIGLSPLTTGIIGWNAVWLTIVVQTLIKITLQLVAAVPLWRRAAVAV